MNQKKDSQETTWITRTHEFLPPIGSDDREKVIGFWSDFYKTVFELSESTSSYQDCFPTKNDSIYKQIVFKRLEQCRGSHLSDEQLRNLQLFIEDSTLEFDEKSMYKTVPNAVKMMILRGEESVVDDSSGKRKKAGFQSVKKGCEESVVDDSSGKRKKAGFQSVKKGYDSSAMTYLLKSSKLTAEEKDSLNVFGQHTLEVLLIHVLSVLFNSVESDSVIRLSTLIDRLDTTVRSQIQLLKNRKSRYEQSISTAKAGVDIAPKPNGSPKNTFHFGNELASFLERKDLIEISIIGNIEDEPNRKKNGSFYLAKHQYVHCKIPASDLPIRFSLPMVCKPEDWQSILQDNQKPKYLSDLRGGYLSSLTADVDERYRLLSSKNLDNFYLEFHDDNSTELCDIMNKLQSQPFKVNSSFLSYIRQNESLLVEQGLILPSFLSKLQIKDIYEKFKKKYYSYHFSKSVRLATLFKELMKLIQRAGYEQYILKLAIAYEGYHFYLPAFLDFRGRIYRSGILHFHERDLARSLVIFAKEDSQVSSSIPISFYCAASHLYRSFDNNDDAVEWFEEAKGTFEEAPNDLLIKFACDAKKPLQFLSCVVVFKEYSTTQDLQAITSYPITQDASASAYQLMSYFLLDKDLAKNTNLIQRPGDSNIQDIYSYLLKEVQVYINDNDKYKNDSLILTVSDNLTRKIVKGIFMPMIYGKTLMSTGIFLQESFSFDLGKRQNAVAQVFYDFFKVKYSRLNCLMNMIQNIGWFSSERGNPVCYKVPLFTTIQDYRKSSETHIWVYSKSTHSRKKVTLSIPSEERDSRKTLSSTFVNFIHQKDACLAMNVVKFLLSDPSIPIPIYTVHDNFITIADCCFSLPLLYISAYKELGPPLLTINEFIYMNCSKPGYHDPEKFKRVIPSRELESLLNNCIPTEFRNKKNLWNKKKTIIVNSYNTYVNAVCGPIDSDTTNAPVATLLATRYEAHERKWESFKKELSDRNCLQY
nr:DNA-directed RNA polymerase [Daucus carota subsp. sativus]WAO26134.1 DNA-directed RNA polymerase [Daucus carota subsp. sativus]WAO26171.1 DNA-directed RNA polymerase [Daucus carota subsp. sativus]